MIKDLQLLDDIPVLLAESQILPVFLFKHSTACPTSFDAWRIFESFAEESEGAAFWKVLVRENRAISQKIAKEIKVKHESPQVILIKNGRAVWNTSHRGITYEALVGQWESSQE